MVAEQGYDPRTEKKTPDSFGLFPGNRRQETVYYLRSTLV